MKRILGVFLTLCLVISPLAICFAEEEIYWGQGPRADFDITDDDFKFDYKGNKVAPTFGDLEIYNTYKAADLVSETQPETDIDTAPQDTGPIQTAPITQTVPRTRPDISAPSTQTRPAPPAPTPARIAPAAPKPAETAPGSSQPASSSAGETSVNRGVVTPAPATTQDDADRPSTKKMKWGQESRSDDSGKKFEWGQKNQAN